MCYLVVVQVFESLEDLPGVEADGGLVVFQRAPFGPQQRRQTPWMKEKTHEAQRQQVHGGFP